MKTMFALNRWLAVMMILFFCPLSGCIEHYAGTRTSTTNRDNGGNLNQNRAIAYNGPKARLAVARFTDKTRKGWYTRRLGEGMSDQLATALVNTGRYIVLERQNIDALVQEQSFGQSGMVRQETAPRMAHFEGAELLIIAAVTEYEHDKGGRSGRASGLSDLPYGDVLSSIAGNTQSAHIAIDLRVVDTETGRLLAATSAEGRSTDIDIRGALGGLSGLAGNVWLGGHENSPLQKALRSVIQQAVDFIVTKTPQTFYRYEAESAVNSSYTTPIRSSQHTAAQGSANGPGKSPVAVPAVTPSAPQPTLRHTGSSGNVGLRPSYNRTTVRSIQHQLNLIGYAAGQEDGMIGTKTRNAIATFQSDFGLPVTGELNKETIRMIRQAN